MEIEILEQQCGGTEFVPRPHRLHLGAQNAEGVDRLQFILPAAWAGCTLALYLRRSDGVQLAAIPLDADDSVTVDRRLTGSGVVSVCTAPVAASTLRMRTISPGNGCTGSGTAPTSCAFSCTAPPLLFTLSTCPPVGA